MIQTTSITMTNLQVIEARNAIQMIGQTNGKEREMAQKLARIGLILDHKARLYEVARRNLIRSNTLKDESGGILYADEYQQVPRTIWTLQFELAALDSDTVGFRCEKLSVGDVGEVSSNVLMALAPLLTDLVVEDGEK